MSFIVTYTSPSGTMYPLRGTIWAFDISRAQRFETREAAQAVLVAAKKFMKAAVYKVAKIVEVA